MNVILPCGDQLKLVKSDAIIYIEAYQNFTKVYAVDGGMIVCSLSMKQLVNKLGKDFIIIHKSYAVNLFFVTSYFKKGYILLEGNKEIPVSRRRQKLFVNTWYHSVNTDLPDT